MGCWREALNFSRDEAPARVSRHGGTVFVIVSEDEDGGQVSWYTQWTGL